MHYITVAIPCTLACGESQREVGVGYLSLKERRGRKGHQKEARRRGEEANLTGTPWAHRRGSLEPQ